MNFFRDYFLPVILIFLFISSGIKGQAEYVPLDHPVYNFLKEMKVRGMVRNLHYDFPNLTRREVIEKINFLWDNRASLSATEKSIIEKYRIEFDYSYCDSLRLNYGFFEGQNSITERFAAIFSDNIKYLYSERNESVNLFFEGVGNYTHGQKFSPEMNNAEIYDIGIRFRGTALDKFGFAFRMSKGLVSGSRGYAPEIDRSLNYSTKFLINQENINNYDITTGYIKYYDTPAEDMEVDFLIGREKTKFGLGYHSRLSFSGEGPYMDLVKFRFRYGIFNFYSFHATTVGELHKGIEDNYTKHFASNRFKLSWPGLFDIGMGQTIVYSGRGIEIGYLNPLIFYKFLEIAMQDRDNGTFFLDFQSDFIPDFEFQLTYFLDETINVNKPNHFSNKSAFQAGFLWTRPFSFDDMFLNFEYTYLRPYVYSHRIPGNTYSAYGIILGHPIGPNSREFYLNAAYNFNSRIRAEIEYVGITSGENLYDSEGNIIFNAGGDIQYSQEKTDGSPEEAYFLDGEKIDNHTFSLKIKTELIRELYIDFILSYNILKNHLHDTIENTTYSVIKFHFGY